MEAKRVNIGVRLLEQSVKKLDEATERTGRSRAAVLELLVALHADEITAETQVPFGLIPSDSRAKKTPRKTVAKKT